MVKNPPAMGETWVRSLGWEDPLEEGMATSAFLPGESHGQRSLAGYGLWGHKESESNFHFLPMSGRIIPTILGKGWGFSRNCATAHFLAFDDWPQNHHGTGGCIIQHADALRYADAQGLVGANSPTILDLADYNRLLPRPRAMPFF